MRYKDYYQILGVARDAAQADIKKAYRRLARKYHPDVSKEADAEERFKEVSEAYETLHDPAKRAAYDELGTHRDGESFAPSQDWASRFGTGMDIDDLPPDLADLFASFARGAPSGRHGKRPRRGADAVADVHISLDEAYRGTQRSFAVPSGSDAGGGPALTVRIPAGVRSGETLRVRGKGGPGLNDGEAGDLLLSIIIDAHPVFEPDGDDVRFELPLAPWEAALGANVETPTPDGRVRLKIAPGTRNGHVLRLAGKGLPIRPSGRGDLLATVRIVLPERLSDAEKALLEQWRSLSAFDPRAKLTEVRTESTVA
jgi:curved DNA-binding protein